MKLRELAKQLGDLEITISEDKFNIKVQLDNSGWVICCPKGNETVAELLLSLLTKYYREPKGGTISNGKRNRYRSRVRDERRKMNYERRQSCIYARPINRTNSLLRLMQRH